MKKGSIVQLKPGFPSFVVENFELFLMGYTPIGYGTPYVVSGEPTEYTCPKCGEIHKSIELEEYPNLSFNSNYFEEVVSPEEVGMEALLST